MGNPEAFSHFVAGLNPEIRKQIGIHVNSNDLDVAIAMAGKIDCYQHVEVGKFVPVKGKQESKIPMKNDRQQRGMQLNVVQGKASSSGTTRNPIKGKKDPNRYRKPRNRNCMVM